MTTRQKEREELDQRAKQGETVAPGGPGGNSLEAQEHLAEGRSRGEQRPKEQIGSEEYQKIGHKFGLSATEMAGAPINEAKFKTGS